MAFITQYTAGDQRIQLGRESFVRKFVWGTNWRQIKVGFFWAVNDNYADTLYGASLKVGVAAGDQYGFDSPNIVDYVGFGHSSTWTGANLSRVISNGQPAYNIGGQLSGRKIGPTIYVGFSNSSSSGYLPVVQSGFTTAYTVLVQKLADGYNFTGYIYGASGVAQLSTYDLITTLEGESNTGNWGYLASSYPVISYGGTQPFDSLCISWSLSVPTVEISRIMVARHF